MLQSQPLQQWEGVSILARSLQPVSYKMTPLTLMKTCCHAAKVGNLARHGVDKPLLADALVLSLAR